MASHSLRRRVIQSVIVPREIAPTLPEARSQVMRSGVPPGKVDEGPRSFRFRQMDPEECLPSSFRTAVLPTGVRLVYCSTPTTRRR